MTGTFDPKARDRLSLCMIVKDEEAMIARCLAAAAPYVAEMIVVDTGSTDRTVEIAMAAGAKVISHPWMDDFSAARNASLEAATRAWALVLDADEEFTCADPSALAAAVLRDDVAGYSLTFKNLRDDGRSAHARLFRLFRRDREGMRYRGELHEQVAAVADGLVSMGGCVRGIEVVHHGYLSSVIESKNKAARNRQLSERLVGSRPEDPFAWYARGTSLVDTDERLACFERARSLLAGAGARARDPWVAMLYLRLGDQLLLSGRMPEAAAVADEAARAFPHQPEFPLIKVRAITSQGQTDGVAQLLATCLDLLAKGRTLEAEPAELEAEARSMLALSSMAAQAWDEAEAELKLALAIARPDSVLPARAMGLLCARTGRLAEARTHLERVLPYAEGEASLLAALSEVLVGLGSWAEAFDLLGQLEQNPAAQERIDEAVEALLARETPERALSVLTGWYELDPTHADACYWLGSMAMHVDEPDVARTLWNKAIVARPGFARAERALAAME